VKDVSRLFEPFGFVTPIPILCKVSFTRAVAAQTSSLPDGLREQWLTIAGNFQSFYKFSITRNYLNPDADCRKHYVQYVFIDASKKGFGTFAYICQDGKASLIMSKTCAAPIKELSWN